MTGRIPLIYIVSSAHSGSTLLDLLLGTHSRIESVGEYKRLGRLYGGPTSKQTCTCGQLFSSCAFWTRVRTMADPAPGDPLWSGNIETDDAAFAGQMEKFSLALLSVSGKSLLCDSSKNRLWLKKLHQTGRFSIHLVHLVRDGRAVAYSNSKRGRPYWFWLRKWAIDQVKIRKMAATMDGLASFTLLRYEDLMADPAGALSPLLGKLGLSWESDQLNFGDVIHHNLAGNSMRHRPGQSIQFDRTYLDVLNAYQWYGGFLAACPGMRLYRYPLLRP